MVSASESDALPCCIGPCGVEPDALAPGSVELAATSSALAPGSVGSPPDWVGPCIPGPIGVPPCWPIAPLNPWTMMSIGGGYRLTLKNETFMNTTSATELAAAIGR